ncbi:MAG TPA: SGNH/GDSL hydrolase family protein [Streptomyces sp.]|uniref:SGNH/GDSL hydrolase family protein n=1 Tax=Streptomyces sp. TaxID=1931 RepID=UPI002CEA8BFA|nr:SGNH/GDSL hydrolase family protein [Streptomyces sp.]HWU12187.1 SGNH/GDSL hydrolase family protein [Streptomyces sp.]
MRPRPSAATRLCIAAVSAVALAVTQVPPASAHGAGGKWAAAWGASQVAGTPIPGNSCPAGSGLEDRTVRNVLFVSAGGDNVRVRLANTFGTRPVSVDRVTVALQQSGAAAVPGTLRTLTFDGRRGTTITAGEDLFSDPLPMRVRALSSLLVSVHVDEATGPVTNHPFTAQGNYLAAGDAALDTSGARYADTPCWMLVSGVDVRGSARTAGAVVTFGDSITDTASTTGNANQRYPDHLARRLQDRAGHTLSVVNAGLGGNRLIAERDGEPYYGPSGISRVERDALGQSGVRAVILQEGINDIGFGASAEDIIAGYRTFIGKVHARGVAVYGGTLLPFRGSFVWTPERQATWSTVNDWIRYSGAFDGVVDFASATASAGDPLTMDPVYDSGDGLHPDDAGTRAMADAVDLGMLLARSAPEDSPRTRTQRR